MKNKIKFIDLSMMGISLLWLLTIDFAHMSTLNWIAAASIAGYVVLYAVRRIINR